MMTEEELDAFRISGEKVRVVRDGLPENDVIGIVVAWNDATVMVRKQNRKIVQLSRDYIYQPVEMER